MASNAGSILALGDAREHRDELKRSRTDTVLRLDENRRRQCVVTGQLARFAPCDVAARSLDWLPLDLRDRVRALLTAGYRAPQELVGWERLTELWPGKVGSPQPSATEDRNSASSASTSIRSCK